MKNRLGDCSRWRWVLAVSAQPADYHIGWRCPAIAYEFPRDHFNHPDFQTEWWYYTGNLRTSEGRRFGFELTFFRQAVDRKPSETVWDRKDVWMAHLALSDIDGGQFLHSERFNRAGPDIAGADLKQARVWNGNWQAQWSFDPSIPGGSTQKLEAVAERFSLDLSLEAEKPPVIHGDERSQPKGRGRGQGIALYFLYAAEHHWHYCFRWEAIFCGRVRVGWITNFSVINWAPIRAAGIGSACS